MSMTKSVFAQTAATVPVGFVTQAIAAASSSTAPSGTVFSIPFFNTAAYAGVISSLDSSSSLSSSAATWTASQFAAQTAPYLLHFKSGASVGRYFLITANTSTQLTVANRGYDLSSSAFAAVGDTFEVVPANTLAILFGSSTVQFLTGSTAAVADNVVLWNGSNWDTYYHNGTNWKRTGSLSNQNNTILYPDESIYVTRRSTTPLSLAFLGTVPSTTEKTDIPGPATTFISNRFPVATTLGAFGLQSSANWLSGTSAATADDVYIWNGFNWDVYFYNGTHWKRTGSLSTFDTLVIPVSGSLYIVRQSTTSVANEALSQPLPYTL